MATLESRTALVGAPSATLAIPALWDRLAWLLFTGLAATVFLTFRHYGVTFDEDVQNTYGDLIVQWYATRGADDGALTYSNLYLYGGLFDTLASLANKVSPFGVYETRHLLNGWVGVIGIAGCWKLARVLGGPRAGLFAAASLALVPDWYGQMFNNPKDIPFAAAMTWATYFMVRLAHRLPTPPLALVVKLGVAIGLALGTRVGGVILFINLAFVLAAFLALEAAVPAHRLRLPRTARHVVRSVWPVVPVAVTVMLVWWPWAQQNPITNPLEALAEFSHFPMEFDFAFFGTWVGTTTLPWYYIPGFLSVKLPEPMVPLVVIGAVLGVWRLGRARLPWLVFGFALLFPPTYIVASHAVLYDNIRHVLFLIPLLAVIAGLVLDRFDRLLIPARAQRIAVWSAVAGFLVYHLGVMVALHPDEYIYFNAFVGGVPGAADRFDMDFWSNSLAETTTAMVAKITASEGPSALWEPHTVAICGPTFSAAYYLPPAWKAVDADDDGITPDFYITQLRAPCDSETEGPVIARTERMGVPLSYARDVRVPPSDE
ncbi:hypothetical protein N825_16035 [Skermanella stibiiresistens SB22]|uniref:Glycosyltransferase RgtA/B/C/D-like domain-containing protein n=1 Tax=Skermanella stibiiresistens SB22 TaxID=1385369 RepID=W9GZ74_9PROT|nr:glycosyltransferase family 39 protein [Skermanella stibiiresistens]EWY37911.1 hypothetical protein N825_16035 [Skermanella stibiiresistens SB22]